MKISNASYKKYCVYPICPVVIFGGQFELWLLQVKRTSERISENLHICANEPSLALYRLAEHVRKALPPTTESRVDVRRIR